MGGGGGRQECLWTLQNETVIIIIIDLFRTMAARETVKKLNHTQHTLTQAKMSICNPIRKPGTTPSPISPNS